MSVPPSACGVMWSGSGLSGVLLAVQLMGVRHSGQVRCPACCACLMALRRSVIHLVVPVRLVAIPTPRCTLVPRLCPLRVNHVHPRLLCLGVSGEGWGQLVK